MINIFKILEEVETGGAAALMIWYIYIYVTLVPLI